MIVLPGGAIVDFAMNLRNGAFSPLRRHRPLAAFISAVAVLGALTLAHWPAGLFGGPARGASAGRRYPAGAAPASTGPTGASAPAGAMAAVTGLASRNPAALRAALAAGYPLSAGDLAPAGTSIRVQPGTWEQRGDYATVRAVVTLPGHAPLAETVYLAREEGRWRVLFADPS
jgi:hypothetical protein